MNAHSMPGPGDSATWRPCVNHPSDPRSADHDELAEAINALAEELMEDEYSPYRPENIAQALGNLPDANLKRLGEMFGQRMDAAAGVRLGYLVREYWKQAARSEAERRIATSQ